MSRKFLFGLLALTASTAVNAKTDLGGCTAIPTVDEWGSPSSLYYVPGTGEICDIPDCGGGRAPPKYDNPACGGYTGTETYSPSFIDISTTTAEVISAPVTTEASTTAAETQTEAETSEATSSSSSEKEPSVTPTITSAPTTFISVTGTGSPSGTGSISIPGTNSTVTTAAPTSAPPTAGAAGLEVTAPVMVGLVAFAGLFIM